MNFFEEIVEGRVLVVVAVAWLLAQIIKIIGTLITERRFEPQRIFGDGGMPSGHSATVTALMIMTGYTAGTESVQFALALMFAAIVMHDAVGVRREAGKHAVSIKELAEAVNKTFLGPNEEIRTENLKVLVGHTPLQVFFGFLLGALTSISYILISIYA